MAHRYRLHVARYRMLITGQAQGVSFRAAGRRMALQHGVRGWVRAHVLMPVAVFAFKHVLTRRTPMGRREMHEVRLPGAQPEPPLTMIVYGERTSRARSCRPLPYVVHRVESQAAGSVQRGNRGMPNWTICARHEVHCYIARVAGMDWEEVSLDLMAYP